MILGKTLLVTNRSDWRKWLAKHHGTEKEIWLIFYRKETGKIRISYNDAVEEALCYGWIDSIVKKVDEQSFAQRFSPRKSTSELSQMNKERIHQLIQQKKMTKAGLDALAHVYNPEEDKPEHFVIPPDILAALKKDKTTWENFQNFPDTYKRIRIAFIEHMRSRGEEIFQKTLTHFLKMTAKNKRFGYVKEMS